jgi:hypothetical protein
MKIQESIWLHPGVLLPMTSSWIKGVHFQNVDKWCREWNEPHHTNATYRGFARHLYHV